MRIDELTVDPTNDFSLDKAVIFHDSLNPKLFADNKMKPEIREGLLEIAKHFEEFIGIPLKVVDITVSGSNAAFTYTPQSDIDLHIVVDVPDGEEYAQLLDAKKNVYNAKHDIKVKDIDVELYAQDSTQEHHSLGIYSVMNDEWVAEPTRQDITIDDQDVRSKYKNYRDRIRVVLKQDDMAVIEDMWQDLKRMRKAGLSSKDAEFSVENLVFKMLRNQGWLEKLDQHTNDITDKQLSIEQRNLQ